MPVTRAVRRQATSHADVRRHFHRGEHVYHGTVRGCRSNGRATV